MHSVKNNNNPEQDKPKQVKPFPYRVQKLIDFYDDKLTDLIEQFAEERNGLDDDFDAKLLNVYDGKWRMIALNVNNSNKKIRLNPDALVNKIKAIVDAIEKNPEPTKETANPSSELKQVEP